MFFLFEWIGWLIILEENCIVFFFYGRNWVIIDYDILNLFVYIIRYGL